MIKVTYKNMKIVPLAISPSPITGKYYTVEPVAFHVDDRTFVVPNSFYWDGSSIPRFAQPTTGGKFAPAHMLPSLLHDWIYRTHVVPRKTADTIYRRCLTATGVSRYNANKQYYAVRAFGWLAWKRRGK